MPDTCTLNAKPRTQQPKEAHISGVVHQHGGLRPFHEKSTCTTQLRLGPYVVQIGSRGGHVPLTIDGNEIRVVPRCPALGSFLNPESHAINIVHLKMSGALVEFAPESFAWATSRRLWWLISGPHAVERILRTQDSQGQSLALAFRSKP